ncbi:hypothetical protein ACFQ10_13105 [Streptomyces indonesiensis]
MRSQVQPVGAGVLITQNLVLTCAHVVNSALGRDRFTQAVPDRNQVVRLRMPHVSAGQEFHGRVVPEMWRPPRARRSGQPSRPHRTCSPTTAIWQCWNSTYPRPRARSPPLSRPPGRRRGRGALDQRS